MRYLMTLARSLAVLSFTMVLMGLSAAIDPTRVAQAQPEATPLPLYALPDARSNAVRSSSTMAFSTLTNELTAVNMYGNTLAIVAPIAGELSDEIPVGRDPRGVAITSDGIRAVVTNRADGSLSVVSLSERQVIQVIDLDGIWPYGIVAAEGHQVYVSLQGSNEVVQVDLAAGVVRERIPTPAVPTAMALWGDFLYVTHLWTGDVSLIYLPQQRVVTTINTGADTTLTASIDIDGTRGLAYLPQTRSYAANRTPTYDTLAFPLINVLQLDNLSMRRVERITPNTVDQPVNMPFAVEIEPFRRWLFIANAGSNNVSIVEIESGDLIANIPVEANPRGLLLSPDSNRLYVHNMISGTVTIVDVATRTITDEIPISTEVSVPFDVLIGAELFHAAHESRMATANGISCATCHLDGMSDGRVWQGIGAGYNTPHLFNLQESAPYNWDGTWDEIADAELKIRDLQAGTGLLDEDVAPNGALDAPHTGLSLDLDALVLYMESLQGPVQPASANPAVQRGREVFNEQSCGACHTLPAGTNLQAYDVGTGGTFDTPTIRWLWQTAPYLHDGSAQTLEDVFEMPGAHQLTQLIPPEDVEALIAYLLTLPSSEE